MDPINWQRLAFHVLDECLTYEDDPIIAERMAVTVFTGIWTQWVKEHEP